jgi:hypothetical protein
MSITRLQQQILQAAKELQHARDRGDEAEVERLEDLLFDLEDELDAEEHDEYLDRHQHGWN